MAVSAGRILILPKGSYDSTTTYEFLDAVYYQGSTYICKKTALNVLPSNTEYWQIMAQGTASASVAGNYYAECDTSASTPAKVITVPATEYFVLQVGDIVNVKFTYTNTATNPTLNINNTGNKPIVYDTSAITSSNLWAGGEAGRITSFMYDGTNWIWISHDVDTNTLDALLDTSISSPTNKQGLIFNGTSNKWENADISSTLAGLTDTEITSPSNGQALVYNSTTQKWENGASGTVRYNEQTDWVQIYYNGNWVNWKLGEMQLDPTKMELTQDEFIAICRRGLQKYMSVGAIIHVNNEYCNTLEVIDVEHDGALNTVDVMAHTQVGNVKFGTSQNYNISSIRNWINSIYIDAFDYDVRELMKTMQVVTMGTTQYDKAKLLSWKEIGLTNYYMDNTDGGTKYPVFTAGVYNTAILDRWRAAGNYGNSSYYWLRSRDTNYSNYVWLVGSSGTCNSNYYTTTGTNGVLPVLRF